MIWAPLEIGNNILQPSLLALSMVWLPLEMSWWGNTSLGCYVFHHYFKELMYLLNQYIADQLHFDPTGILCIIAIIRFAVIYSTLLGPVGHYTLLAPKLLYTRVRSVMKLNLNSYRQNSQTSNMEKRP